MTNMDGKYMWVRKLLKNMDEKQLTELFHDVDDIEALHRIYSCAYKLFIEYKLKPHEKPEEDDIYVNSSCERDYIQKDYEEEHEAQDNRDRAADINSNLGDK